MNLRSPWASKIEDAGFQCYRLTKGSRNTYDQAPSGKFLGQVDLITRRGFMEIHVGDLVTDFDHLQSGGMKMAELSIGSRWQVRMETKSTNAAEHRQRDCWE